MNLFALSGVLIVASSGLMAIFMFAVGRRRMHYLWGLFSLSVLVWGLGVFIIASTDSQRIADLWWRIAHIGVAFIPVLFLHFVYMFLDRRRPITLAALYLLATFFAAAAIGTDYLIAEMRFVFDQFYYDSPPGILYPFFTVYFFGLVAFSHYILWRALQDTTDQLTRTRIKYFFLGMMASFAGGSMSFLPVYGIDVYPVLNITVFAYPLIVGYAIYKHDLFNIKFVAVQIFTYLLWLLLLVRTFFSDTTQDFLLNGGLFVATVILGIFLIRSVLLEVRSRERIEHLADNLRKANARLKELDRQKSEFVSIASHQLRSPLTAMKGYASMLLEGEYGTVPGKIRDVVEKIYEASNNMTTVVEDFLNVSRIEQGRMEYHTSEFDLGELAAEVTEEMQPTAQSEGLELAFAQPDTRCNVVADEGKTRQIVRNLIDNAIKYTPEGSITVRAYSDSADACVSVSDTGVGMSRETLDRLFRKFSRSEEANEVNVSGTGLGLYVGKQMAEAQGGSIEAQSPGEGQGSTFTLRLPCATDNAA